MAAGPRALQLRRFSPFSFLGSLTRRSRVGRGDIGPEPLVALHGMPQRETSAGPLSEVGLCVPWFAPTTLRGRLSWSPPLIVVSFASFFLFSFSLFFCSSFLFFFASFFFFFVFLFLCLFLACGLHTSGRPSFPSLDTR